MRSLKDLKTYKFDTSEYVVINKTDTFEEMVKKLLKAKK